jgi:hypothetical protein
MENAIEKTFNNNRIIDIAVNLYGISIQSYPFQE